MTASEFSDGIGLPPILASISSLAVVPRMAPGVRHGRRIAMASGENHRGSELRDGIEILGELFRQVNAAMRVGITRQIADMQSDALPGQPLHIRHRLAIGCRGVHLGLLQDGEDACGRRMARLAGRAGRNADQDAVAVDEGKLLRNRHDDGDRALWRALRMPDELPRLETGVIWIGARRGLRNALCPRVFSRTAPRPNKPMTDLRLRSVGNRRGICLP